LLAAALAMQLADFGPLNSTYSGNSQIRYAG